MAMAWKGNSRISFAVRAAANTLDFLNIPAQMLFLVAGTKRHALMSPSSKI